MESSYSSRIDSDYFKKKAIAFTEFSKDWELMSVICPNIKSGTTPAERDETLKRGIALLKTNDIRNNIVSPILVEKYFYIDEETNKKMEASSLQGKDVLINIVGASTDVIGRVSFVPENFIQANITQAMARLRVEVESVLPEYLFVFLLTSYGKEQTIRIARQTEQFNMNLIEVGCFRVCVPRLIFQQHISRVVISANSLENKAQKLYSTVQKKLSEKLYYCETRNKENFAVKTLSDSFSANRIDAEYYQPKYEQYEKNIKKNKTGFTFIKTEFDLVTEKCDRRLNHYQYIEIGDIDIWEGIANFCNISTEKLPDNAKIMTKANDILVSTVRPNRGAVAILEQDDLLVSGAFTVLREKGDYPKEVLQVLLRSEMYRDWMLRYNVGTSYPVIKDNDILNLPIPILDEELKKEIVNSVQESSKLRKKAKKLLDIAIKAVEMAIETDEETAIAWLKGQGV